MFLDTQRQGEGFLTTGLEFRGSKLASGSCNVTVDVLRITVSIEKFNGELEMEMITQELTAGLFDSKGLDRSFTSRGFFDLHLDPASVPSVLLSDKGFVKDGFLHLSATVSLKLPKPFLYK